MRPWAIFVALLCGCYAPQPPAGAPCDDQQPCPTGQSCVAGFCDGIAMVDGPKPMNDGSLPPDTSSNSDVDGDGIANMQDNCPMYSNPGQGNEDGDMLGDPCDPCPIAAANPPSDPDGDGVSDSCDPRPTTPGDAIALFEGFHSGVPATWQVVGGTATQSGDDIVLSSNNLAALVSPMAAPTNATVTMKARINQTTGNADAALAVAIPYDPGQDLGISCELYAPNAGSSTGRELAIWDSVAQVERARKQYNWQTNVVYTVQMRRTNTSYNCAVTPASGTGDSVSGNSNANPNNSRVGALLFAASANISWLLVVTSN